MGKGEIARNEQFLLFPQCFQKSCTADTGLETGLVWERVDMTRLLTDLMTFYAALNIIIVTRTAYIFMFVLDLSVLPKDTLRKKKKEKKTECLN